MSTIQAKVKEIIDDAENLKKRADIHFAKAEYEDAITTYQSALKKLIVLAGLPMGESTVMR